MRIQTFRHHMGGPPGPWALKHAVVAAADLAADVKVSSESPPPARRISALAPERRAA